MNNNFLSFLASGGVEEAKTTRSGGVRKERNPNPLTLSIRVWKDGSVYPSQALVDKFSLEYQQGTVVDIPANAEKSASKKVTPGGGNGFDVIDSSVWANYKGEGRLLFIAPVAKSQPKVDLFSQVGYDDKGIPASKVMEQGSSTFGEKTLLPLLKEVYGIELDDKKPYVDMSVVEEVPGPDGTTINIAERYTLKVALAPKKIARGTNIGQPDYVRRENYVAYAFLPEEVLTQEEAQEADQGENSPAASVTESATQ